MRALRQWRGMLCGMSSIPATASGPARAARPAYWFPLALFGLIIGVSVPLHEAELMTAVPPVGWVSYSPLTRAVSPSTAYSSSLAIVPSRGGGPFSVPEGWYWAGALTIAFLLTTVWYRRASHDAGRSRAGWPYLSTGLVLTALITVVPLLLMQRAYLPDWLWLQRQWTMGTFALLVIAVALGMLAWRARGRALAIITLAYAAAALIADWPALRAARILVLGHLGDPRQTLSLITEPPQPYPSALLLVALLLLVAATLTFGWPGSFGWPARFRRHQD